MVTSHLISIMLFLGNQHCDSNKYFSKNTNQLLLSPHLCSRYTTALLAELSMNNLTCWGVHHFTRSDSSFFVSTWQVMGHVDETLFLTESVRMFQKISIWIGRLGKIPFPKTCQITQPVDTWLKQQKKEEFPPFCFCLLGWAGSSHLLPSSECSSICSSGSPTLTKLSHWLS
jgi:hypothetical protein